MAFVFPIHRATTSLMAFCVFSPRGGTISASSLRVRNLFTLKPDFAKSFSWPFLWLRSLLKPIYWSNIANSRTLLRSHGTRFVNAFQMEERVSSLYTANLVLQLRIGILTEDDPYLTIVLVTRLIF